MWVAILVFRLGVMLSERYANIRILEQFLHSFNVRHASLHEYIDDVIALSASAKAMKSARLSVPDEAWRLLLVKRAAAFEVSLVEILDLQFFCDNQCHLVAELLLGLFYVFLFNQRYASLPSDDSMCSM